MDGAARNAHVGAVSVPSETIATQRGRRLRIEDMIIVVDGCVERERVANCTDPEPERSVMKLRKNSEKVSPGTYEAIWYHTAEIS